MDPHTQALITALETQAAAAQADLITPGATAAQQLAARQTLAYAHASLIQLRGAGTVTTRTIIVGRTRFGAESIFVVAQRELGDPLRYTTIQAYNGFQGVALTAGQELTLPIV